MTTNPRQSFKLKLCLWILGVSVLAFAAIFYACLHFVKIEVRNDLDAVVNAKLDYVLRAIDEGLTNTEVSAQNLESISKSPLITHRRDSLFALCQHFLYANPHIQGVAVGYEPGVVVGHEEGFAPYIMRTKSGFIKKDLAENKDYRTSDWYKTTKEKGKPYWSKAFIESNGTMVTSYCVPLRNVKGDIYAVLALDLNLDVMANDIQRLRPYQTAMLTVVDRDGTFIAHPNHDFILKESLKSLIEKAEYAPNRRILEDIESHKRNSDEYKTDEDKIFIYYAPVEKTGWTVTLEVPRAEVAKGYDKMFKALLFDMIIGLILLLIVSVYIINRLTKPLENFADAARKMSHGNFNVELPLIEDHNELYDLRQALASMEISLNRYISDLKKTENEKAAFASELNIARNIQLAMVPKIFPPYPDRHEIDIHASLTPAKAVGGDLYDFFLDGDTLYFCIGDVSGKGVPASLFMAITRALFRNTALHEKSPAKIAYALNNAIAQGNEEGMFVTMVIGKMDLVSGEFTCCNAGHNPPVSNGSLDYKTMLVRPSDEIAYMKSLSTNIPIGVFEDYYYQEISMHIEPGVNLFLYTDGVTEAENKHKELYGEDRLLDCLKKIGRDASSEEIITGVVDDVRLYAENTDQSDDITLLCFKFRSAD